MNNFNFKNTKISLIMGIVKDDIRNKEIIQSIVNQTLSEFQLICIKKDKSVSNFIENTFSDDDRLLFLDDDSQIFDFIEGEYILFIDEYTLLEPTVLERLYGKAKAVKADITCCNSISVKASSKKDNLSAKYSDATELFEKIPLLLHFKYEYVILHVLSRRKG